MNYWFIFIDSVQHNSATKQRTGLRYTESTHLSRSTMIFSAIALIRELGILSLSRTFVVEGCAGVMRDFLCPLLSLFTFCAVLLLIPLWNDLS